MTSHRWGDTIRVTKSLLTGAAGVPALSMHQPFATWVARGFRRNKWLRFKVGAHRLFYLYATNKRPPAHWFDRDYEDAYYESDFISLPGDIVRGRFADKERFVIAEVDARIERDSVIRSAIVGLALLDERMASEVEEGGFPFVGGVLFNESIPLVRLMNRPYGGLFYPFGQGETG